MAKPSPATGGRRGGSPDQWSNSKITLEKSLWDLILTHLNTKKRVDVFTLSIYGLVIFPKALGHIDKTVSYLLDRLDKRVTPVPVILAKTFRIWGAIGYAHLLVLRQYRSRQFIPTTQGLTQCEFVYKGDNYKKKAREISNAWNQTYRMKGLAVNPMTTPEYNWW
ncbi:hypothetical protein Godav_005218 [Gossypium davidsonii]|uniref:Uncharacterized protein n=1 Tax=Gossypium davidsonii TaxID=34287 RepID=A0A7J8TFW1_GOSDV|nr:hypothetical protein [Gossypium davidsonii]